MSFSRREFLRRGASASLAFGLGGVIRLPGSARAWDAPFGNDGPAAADPFLTALGARALDAAREAGATYADIRFTLTQREVVQLINRTLEVPRRELLYAVGVRVLVDGTWGFAASTQWTSDDVVACARTAVAQAKGYAWSVQSRVELAPTPPVPNGTWTMPVKRDPFDVSVTEKAAYLRDAHEGALAIPGIKRVESRSSWRRQDKTFMSTDGSVIGQRLYLALDQPYAQVTTSRYVDTIEGRNANCFTPQGRGYEALTDIDYPERLIRLAKEAKIKLTAKPIDVGRYDVVFDAYSMAAFVAQTIGDAAQIDRALGYEANARGTSYLAPPADVLGKLQLAPDFVTITAGRSAPGSAAWTQWDDEGVTPEDFALVSNGVFTDYQTTREQAMWLSDWYRSEGRLVRSHGCAGGWDAERMPRQCNANLSLRPAAHEASFADLVAGTARGIAVVDATFLSDQQLRNGQGGADIAYEIRNGKLGAPISGLAFLYRTPDHWRSLTALGGPASYETYGFLGMKGQFDDPAAFSVGAVPAKFTNVRVIDIDQRGAS